MLDMPVRVPLSNGGFALVDSGDAAIVLSKTWKRIDRKYTSYAGCSTGVYLHRLLSVDAHGMDVDHWDGNGLNNCRQNLRVCTRQQNLANMRSRRGASPYKGVHWHKKAHRWQADIRKDRRTIYLGLHDTEEEAAKAYDRKALELFGSFARLNFPQEAV